ncbi:endonuclease/exonuclease/phosphatase family protein [Roseimaritima sediminicola]|uniref:endonuclease/exonuclease/phosphatase family protein n=1 Tax=Roseimaritima sediminicola TaxID=2662066 RepID=UPI001F400970|nr:endonuclease/exonuclease/phosphatase family protein [Roseimaritima sediminicola]
MQLSFSENRFLRPVARLARPVALAMLGLLCFAGPGQSEEPIRLRVLSYNIHHGEGVDGKLDLQRIAAVIRSVEPDIVALQEVDQNVQRSESVDQPAELARQTEMHVAFGANIPLQGGHYGNAILSRLPIERADNHLLPNHNRGEQRGVLVARLKAREGGPTITLFATHFDHRRDDTGRLASVQAINRHLGHSGDAPALLAGDLNDVIGSPTLDRLAAVWTRSNDQPLPTIPVAQPQRQIDFVLYHPADRWKVVEVRVLDEAVASDHRPILAVLELLPAK